MRGYLFLNRYIMYVCTYTYDEQEGVARSLLCSSNTVVITLHWIVDSLMRCIRKILLVNCIDLYCLLYTHVLFRSAMNNQLN